MSPGGYAVVAIIALALGVAALAVAGHGTLTIVGVMLLVWSGEVAVRARLLAEGVVRD